MEFAESILFLLLILLLITSLKANIFLFLCGSAIFLFFIIQLFFLSPIQILAIVINSLLFNPIGLFILFWPLIFDILIRNLKKINQKRIRS
jgi:hypothetical protein